MHKRAIWKVVLFGLFTAGIYNIYWLYKTHKELKGFNAEVPPIGTAIAAFCASYIGSILTVFATIDETRIYTEVLIAGFALTLAAYITLLVWMYKYCAAAAIVTSGLNSLARSYALWIVLTFLSLDFIWYGIMQHGYNAVGTKPVEHPPTPPRVQS